MVRGGLRGGEELTEFSADPISNQIAAVVGPTLETCSSSFTVAA